MANFKIGDRVVHLMSGVHGQLSLPSTYNPAMDMSSFTFRPDPGYENFCALYYETAFMAESEWALIEATKGI